MNKGYGNTLFKCSYKTPDGAGTEALICRVFGEQFGGLFERDGEVQVQKELAEAGLVSKLLCRYSMNKAVKPGPNIV